MAFDLATATPVSPDSGGFDLATAKPVVAKAGSGNSAVDAGNALGSGFMRGMVRIAGLPVDTAANVLDLGKAAIGAPYTAITGKAAPDWLTPVDRSKVVGSGEYLLGKVRSVPGGKSLVDPVNPDYEGGYLQAVGGGIVGGVNTNALAQAAISTVAGKAVGDLTGNPALAIAAGLSPAAAQNAVAAATKYAVRGGEAGRQNMQQRVSDLKNAGVDNPTLGLASGNALISGTENLLQSTPGAVGIMRRNRDTAISGMDATTGQAADLASTNRGAMESGRSIQTGAKSFKDDFKTAQQALYDKLDQYIPAQQPTNVANTTTALTALNADIPTMPQLSKQFKNSRIVGIEDALKSDMAGSPTGGPTTVSSILGANGQPIVLAPQGAPTPARTDIPFDAVKKTRTLVGSEIADNSMMSDVPRSKWNPLYGALSEDMKGAATAAGPQAENALTRATDYTRAGIGRMERIAPIVDRQAPEQSFTALANTLKENTSTFQAVKKSLPEDARGDFAGTIIERLGKAKSGQQDDAGSKWSPETFLTNWNNIKPQARAELLSGIPNASEVGSLVDAVAKSSAYMRDGSKMWANPSGTAANVAARGLIGTIGAGGAGALAGMVSPAVPITAGLGVLGINGLARVLTSQRAREATMQRTEVDPTTQNAIARALFSSGQLDQQ